MDRISKSSLFTVVWVFFAAVPLFAANSSDIPGTLNQLEVDQDIENVQLDITQPADGEVIDNGDEVTVEFDLNNYRAGEEIGQHVHVIVDNEPYIAHYNADKPLVLKDLSEGTHTLRVFPARHYHLSVKAPDAYDTIYFHVGKKDNDFEFDRTEPYITYSRPKGTYKRDAADKLLLDFYAQHVDIGDDAYVEYQIDDRTPRRLDEWRPVILPNLEPGKHDVTLRLVDESGELIENGGYNKTTRTITVK